MMPNAAIPTPEEVHDLKAQWCADPCWDLEDTEGFEAHREELASFAKDQQARWEKEAGERLAKKAERLGCPGNHALALYVEVLEERIAKIEARLNT